MRVLFVATPGIGHMFPMISLAWALRAAGHDVLVATGGDALVADKAGLQVVDICPGKEITGLFTEVAQEHPELIQEMLHGRMKGLRDAAVGFAKLSELYVDATVEVAEGWRPDLVVTSQVEGVGLVVGAKLGIPVVEHAFGFARNKTTNDVLFEHMRGAFERHGANALPKWTFIDFAPPSMALGDEHGLKMRYVPYNGGAVLPQWLFDKPERPRIAVTLGTLAPKWNGIATVERVIEVAPGVPAEFVLALGDVDTSELGLPSNVKAITGWVPLGSLLQSCTAQIHHGGAGTTLTAVAAGVTQLVLPDGTDRHANAMAVHQRGVGLEIKPEDVTPETIERLLNDEAWRRAAAEVQEEISTMPSPTELVHQLVEFAGQ